MEFLAIPQSGSLRTYSACKLISNTFLLKSFVWLSVQKKGIKYLLNHAISTLNKTTAAYLNSSQITAMRQINFNMHLLLQYSQRNRGKLYYILHHQIGLLLWALL
jgi:hypothetical protein